MQNTTASQEFLFFLVKKGEEKHRKNLMKLAELHRIEMDVRISFYFKQLVS